MGKLECSQGEIIWSRSCRVGFLPQHMELASDTLIQEYFDDHDTDYYEYQERAYTMRFEQYTRELNIQSVLNHTRGSLSG